MKTITPQQLLHRLQQLFPNLQSVTRDEWQEFIEREQPFNHTDLHNVVVNWEDTTEYPEATWRDATESDIGDTPVDARFSSYDFTSETVAHHGKLIGFTKTCDGIQWLDDDNDDWEFCQVKSLPDMGNPISTFPKDNYHTHLLFMGGKWIRGSRSTNDKVFWSDGETMAWDIENQPTHWKPLPENSSNSQ